MTGWPAVAATTGLMVVALAGLNVRLYRRMRAARLNIGPLPSQRNGDDER